MPAMALSLNRVGGGRMRALMAVWTAIIKRHIVMLLRFTILNLIDH